MDRGKIENSLHREIEQLRKSIETLASFPDIDLAELYVAKKCAARILGVCYRTLERWYNSGYIDCIRIGGSKVFRRCRDKIVRKLFPNCMLNISTVPVAKYELYA